MSEIPITNEDLPEHRVAIVVFASVHAVDELDAGHIAEAAVRAALRSGVSPEHGDLELRRPARQGDSGPLRVRVPVHEIRELGMACGNGYLWVSPTGKAYRRS